jgi:glycosyltransferase involved in cell wall biosynthesis
VTRPAPIRRLAVVVPARNEEALLGHCLDSVVAAVDQARSARPELAAAVIVVADRCTDETAARAQAAGAQVVTSDAGSVGVARRAGVDAALALRPATAAHETWIASTDADTRVPPAWLRHQLDQADRGVGLVVGRAVPDRRELDERTWLRWHARHLDADVGAHVHGANLGFRLDAYLAVGGWPPLNQHEDRRLVDAMLEAGVPAAAGLEVITSARLRNRAPGGFAGYLRDLGGPVLSDDVQSPA